MEGIEDVEEEEEVQEFKESGKISAENEVEIIQLIRAKPFSDSITKTPSLSNYQLQMFKRTK